MAEAKQSLPATMPLAPADTQGLYRADPWSWSRAQAASLRAQDYAAVDWDHLIEEVEDLARRDEGSWISLCSESIANMLAIEYAGGHDATRRWAHEVNVVRSQMLNVLQQNPGMQSILGVLLERAWRRARWDGINKVLAAHGDPVGEIGPQWNEQVPVDCPYALDQITGVTVKPMQRLRDAEVDRTMWPPSVAQALNRILGTNLPILPVPPQPASGPRRIRRGRSR